MALLCLGFRLYAQANYALAVALLTGLLVLLFLVRGRGPGRGAGDAHHRHRARPPCSRSAPTCCGRPGIRPRAAGAGEAGRGYRLHLRALLAGDMAALHETRNAARSARTTCSPPRTPARRAAQRPGRRIVERAESLLSNANRLIRAVIPIEAMLIDGATLPALPELERFAGEVDAASARSPPACATASRCSSRRCASRTRWPRASRTDDGDDAVDAALADACDRIADSIDSLAHILRESPPRRPRPSRQPVKLRHAQDRHPRPLPAARLAGPGREVRRQPLPGDPPRRRRPPPHLQGRQVLPARSGPRPGTRGSASTTTPPSACRCRCCPPCR